MLFDLVIVHGKTEDGSVYQKSYFYDDYQQGVYEDYATRVRAELALVGNIELEFVSVNYKSRNVQVEHLSPPYVVVRPDNSFQAVYGLSPCYETREAIANEVSRSNVGDNVGVVTKGHFPRFVEKGE